MAPHAALAEVGADYTLVLVKEDDRGQRPSAYLSLNPWGQPSWTLTRGRFQDPPASDSANLGTHFDRLAQRPSIRRMMTEQGLE